MTIVAMTERIMMIKGVKNGAVLFDFRWKRKQRLLKQRFLAVHHDFHWF